MGAASVLLHKGTDGLGAEKATAFKPRIREQIIDHWSEFVGKPIVNRHPKTRLGLPQHLGRKYPSHRFAQKILRGGPYRTANFETRGHVPGYELRQALVQERHSYFDR